MTVYQITCDGPGPHNPPSGIIGTTDAPPKPGQRCGAAVCIPPDPAPVKSSFSTVQANWAWNEIALFNGSTGGRMLNRKLVSMGTKTSSNTWTLTLTVTLA